MKEIETGVYEIPLIVSDSLTSKKDYINQCIIQAQRNIVDFSKEYGYEAYVCPSFMKKAEIFATQDDFKKVISGYLDLPKGFILPATVSAVLEEEIFMSISPSLYKDIYPIEGEKEKGYERLVTHEIAHRLHVRILHGDEEAMGPSWFYEGFATFVAKQFLDFDCDKNTMWDIIENNKQVPYKYYAAIFRYLSKKVNLHELVMSTSKDTFIKDIKSTL